MVMKLGVNFSVWPTYFIKPQINNSHTISDKRRFINAEIVDRPGQR